MKKENMNKMMRIAATLLLAVVTLTVSAQDKRDMFNPVHHSVTSQMIAPDARSAGMGDVGVATDPDVVSQYWNPAKYPFTISRAGVALNYTPWLRQLVNDIDLAYLAGYYRIGDYSAVSASLRYFSLGEVMMGTGVDNMDFDNAQTINPYEMSIDAAYSLMLSEKFSLGAAVRWIYSDLTYKFDEDNSPGSAFAADIACYYQNYINIGQRECQLGLGLNISNIGSKITFGGDDNSEFIPTNLRLGASLMIPVDEYNRFTIADLSEARGRRRRPGLSGPRAERLLRRVFHQRYLQELQRCAQRHEGRVGRDSVERRCRICVPRPVLCPCRLPPRGREQG